MEISEIDPATTTDAGLADWHEVLGAAAAHDSPAAPPPVLADTMARLRNPFKTARRLHWLGRAGGVPAAICELKLEEAPNLEVGELTLTVSPALRRRGLGRALLAVALDRLVAEQRPTITAEALIGAPGEQFLHALGFSRALTDQEGILRLDDIDAADLDGLVAALSADYRLERWLRHVPADSIESFVRAKDAIGDAPTGDLKWRPPAFEAARWRSMEEVFERRGHQLRIVAAIHRSSSDVAGLTELAFATVNPYRATQEDTSVVPAHRGHGLGLIIKADMLRWLRSDCPQVREIVTWNAASNTHMLAINDRLGSRHERTWGEFQAEVTTVTTRLQTG